jgi:TfoX/Sxy family transcriptional regulator of competence genes
MAYSEKLSNRIREAIAELPKVEERLMFGGVCYMLNGKMCIGVVDDEMMCRIGPEVYEVALEKRGCREMVFTGRPMKGYVYVSNDGMKTKKEFDYWIDLCVKFNKFAKASKKKTNSKTAKKIAVKKKKVKIK